MNALGSVKLSIGHEAVSRQYYLLVPWPRQLTTYCWFWKSDFRSWALMTWHCYLTPFYWTDFL